jgi:arylsulfatase A
MKIFTAFAALCLALHSHAALAAPTHPNIVLILSDDYGYGSASCYGARADLIRTPNIDRLAREGRRFTDANTTSSVCSPTRYSLLTGRYCWRTSLQHEVLGTTSPLHIEADRFNLATLLKKHGYHTAAIGKWHLGYGAAPKVDFTKELKPGPLEIGFDYHFGVPANHGDIAGVYVENHRVLGLRSDKLDPQTKGKNFKGRAYLGLDAPHRVDVDVMPFVTNKTVQWIERQTDAAPFFLYYTPVAVHNPVTPSEKTKGTSKAGPYGDWIHELDDSVGSVLDALDRKGFTENTLVLFTSDNGGVNKPKTAGDATDALDAGLAISGPFRGGKHDVWEGGFRVPYVLRWPGRVPPGSVCDETLSLVDTIATVAALVGEPLPELKVGAEDSHNMLSAWLAEKYESPIRPDIILHSADGNFAIRRGRWKWIEGDYHPGTKAGAAKQRAEQFHRQLYDLSEDVAETTDVASGYRQVASELETLLQRYRKGGYSREVPPPPPAEPTAEPLDAMVGKTVRAEDFETVPGTPWVKVRGNWTAKANVLTGSQIGGQPGPAAMRCPLKLAACDIQYEVSLPFGTTHSLRIQGSQPDHVFLVHVANRFLSIARQPTASEPRGNVVLTTEKLRLSPDQWARVRVHLGGDELAAQIGDTVVRAHHPTLTETKPAIALLVNGKGVDFRNLVISEPHHD